LATPTKTTLVLPFETITKGVSGVEQGFQGESPDAFIVSNRADIRDVQPWIDSDATSALEQIDYESYFAIAAFHGYRTVGPFKITIESVTRENDDLVIQVTLEEPCYACPRTPAATSPYHLVRVKKNGDWNREMNLYIMYANQRKLVESHKIP